MEQTKKNQTGYWLVKSFISFFMLFSAYITYSQAAGIAKLGFPDYFRIELVTAKVIGAIVLLLPLTPLRVKEWVYAGFIIAMVSGLIAHICSNDPVSKIIFVSVDLVLILLSIHYVSKKELLNSQYQTIQK
nr:DoxX family protein [Mucilaginibacter sp. L294]